MFELSAVVIVTICGKSYKKVCHNGASLDNKMETGLSKYIIVFLVHFESIYKFLLIIIFLNNNNNNLYSLILLIQDWTTCDLYERERVEGEVLKF